MILKRREMLSGHLLFRELDIMGGSTLFFSVLVNMHPLPCIFCLSFTGLLHASIERDALTFPFLTCCSTFPFTL